VRIVGGRLKGRNLISPKTKGLRPTADRVRESIFNILVHGTDGFTLEDVAVIDVFCGTGALGLEAISRGARHGVFIDLDMCALEYVNKNAGSMGLGGEVLTLKLDAKNLGQPPEFVKSPAAVVFMDPPYNQGLADLALRGLKEKGWLESGAFCVVEIAVKEILNIPKNFNLLNERNYGATRVVFLRFDSPYD
jgi:16S rRNA (guanine966-N2)-methyltransferase